MVFSSQVFLFYFLPVALLGNYLLPVRWRNLFLTLVSYVFYGWWNPWFVGLMLFSSTIDWTAGWLMFRPGATPRRRKLLVLVSVASNLALLGFFKYFMFAEQNVNRLLELFGREPFPVVTILLPAGISFYTFESMSYVIDLYRGDAKRARSFSDFTCFVSLFPHLIAGPIVRYQDLAAQLNERPQRGELFGEGALRFMIGFAKKILIANTVSEAANLAFDHAGGLTPAAAWIGLLAYTLQIYFDFSGYSDMAIGLGRMLGFRIVENFASPYRAESFTDFWTRWHMSLTRWMRDYLYIPLGGNRGGERRTMRNLALVFLLSGLWHGAAWHFVAWGAFHGAMITLERLSPQRSLWAFLPRPARIGVTFLMVMVGWVFFRAGSVAHAFDYLGALFVGRGDPASGALVAAATARPAFLLAATLGLGIVFFGRESRHVAEAAVSRVSLATVSVALFAWSVLALFTQAENPFLYFQF
jgi:alginate O-acetyltransferase complex protein AlgI